MQFETTNKSFIGELRLHKQQRSMCVMADVSFGGGHGDVWMTEGLVYEFWVKGVHRLFRAACLQVNPANKQVHMLIYGGDTWGRYANGNEIRLACSDFQAAYRVSHHGPALVDKTAQGVKNLLGLEAPKGIAYIGDDRGEDVMYSMNDFNDNPVRSSYYLSLMFDPVQTELFQRKRNISEGGQIGGKLTWYSSKSKNKLGANNQEYNSERSLLEESLSNKYGFRSDSIMGKTQELLESMPSDGGASRSHVANGIDQTSRIFREGDVLLSRGSAIQYVDQYGGETGVEYCRVWTKDRGYMNMSDTMKRTGNIRKFDDSVMSTPWNLNIAPMSNGNGSFEGSTNIVKGGDGYYAKKYMFSIENLAWKTSNTPGFTYSDLPYCERGNNGGRVMWFPPYDLKVSEQNNARWDENNFLGRPEPIYTYQNTSRSGQVSFKVIVEIISVVVLWL